MTNEYYNISGWPAQGASGDSASARSELVAIQSGFNKLPPMAGLGSQIVIVNPAGNQLSSATPETLGLQRVNWVPAGGTADAITATYSPAPTAVVDGMLFFVRALAANATTTPTFSPNAFPAHLTTRAGGAALNLGDIPGANAEIILRYNLANTRYELLNPAVAISLSGGSVNATTVTASGLVDISGASAGQIKFPVTQNPSADPNTLDDYEEGTWTPTLGGTATYSLHSGHYTKIGNIVQINAMLQLSAIGTGNTTNISGLPFAANNTAGEYWSMPVGSLIGGATSIVSILGYVSNGATTIGFVSWTAAAVAPTTNPIFGSATTLRASGVYQAA